MEMEVVNEDTPTSGTNIVEGKKKPYFLRRRRGIPTDDNQYNSHSQQ